MLNPIKTPTQMMYEQANLPHYGKGGDVVGQFASRIQDAIRKYTKAVGKPPSAEEVKQLEDHIRSLSQPSPKPMETTARMQQQTPFANQLVDASGRPYPAVTTPEGRTITPERAKGVTTRESIGPFQGVPSQFDMTPVNIKARAYPKGQFQNAFPEDEFMSMANTGRTGNRTWNKSFTPSTEELAARQHTTEEALTGAGDEAMSGLGALRATEGDIPQMTSASAPFAERAAQLEGPGLDKLTDEMMLGKHGSLVDKVVSDFKARGIEPDQEDIVNAINAMINPMRHNYTGTNPIGLRPPQPGGGGRPSPEMLSWRDEARMSGLPETVVTKHPSDWKPQNQRDYLLDTEPAQRAPFAKDWQLQELEDRRRRAAAVEGKAAGGYMQSPRDMQAEMMVRGYDQGGMTRPLFGQDQPMSVEQYLRSGVSDSPNLVEERIRRNMEDAKYKQDMTKRMTREAPTPRERLRNTFMGPTGEIMFGSPEGKYFGMGAVDAVGFIPQVSPLTAPFYGAESGYNVGKDLAMGDYGSAALNTALAFPPAQLIKGAFNVGKQAYGAGKEALRNASPKLKYIPGLGLSGSVLDVNPQSSFNQ